ncbi:MAG: ATP-binding protein [Candidatus Izemoplasmataceae bacterium]
MFLGREKELKMLSDYYDSNSFEFGVIHGRRRVGKTTLLKESIKGKKSLYLLAQQANAKTNLELFSKRYGELLGVGQITYDSFRDFFEAIFKEDHLVVVLDEFSYLTEVDPSIESVLQGLIDTYKEMTSIKFIISGSEIGMFNNHFSVSKPLFNRQTFSYHLKECDYLESSLYYPQFKAVDKVRAYAVFGGLPYYLSQIDDERSIEENIKRLITNENARFSNEVNMLLHTELRSIQEYQSVLQAIHSGSTKLSEIDTKSRIQDTAKTSKYVKKLMELEIIEKEYKFLESPNSKNHLYRIKNNFIAFHYRFVWKNQAARVLMSSDDFYDTFIKDDLEQFVSLRFEKIGEQFLIRKYKSRNHEPIMNIGRYWYNDKKSKTDVEIDLCVQTKNYIHIYECKWTNNIIGESIMNQLIEKGKYLKANKYGAFSKNGYHDLILDKDYDLVTVEDLFK